MNKFSKACGLPLWVLENFFVRRMTGPRWAYAVLWERLPRPRMQTFFYNSYPTPIDIFRHH